MIACRIVLGQGKRELLLRTPLLSAAGALGMDPGGHPALESGYLAAYVTPPLTVGPQAGDEVPALARTSAGFILRTRRRNPGVSRALRVYGRAWERLGLPIIAALYGTTRGDLLLASERCAAYDAIQAIELHMPHDCPPQTLGKMVAALARESPTPLLVVLQPDHPEDAAQEAASAGADALVVAAPLLGRAQDAEGRWVRGPLHTPGLAPHYAELVQRVAESVPLPIIGRGGVATARDALNMLHAGATALQLDSLLMVEPGAPAMLTRDLEGLLGAGLAGGWDDALRELREASEQSLVDDPR